MSSDLHKLILTKEQVWGLKLDRRGSLISVPTISNCPEGEDAKLEALSQEFGGPLRLNFGLDSSPSNRELLFKDLGETMTEDSILDSQYLDPNTPEGNDVNRNEVLNGEIEALEAREEKKKEVLKRILDLRNASGRGIQRENVRRIVEFFSRNKGEDGKGADTGSPEVQGEFKWTDE